MAADANAGVRVRISQDGLQGFLSLAKPDKGDTYALSEVMKVIDAKGIRYNIDQETVQEMLKTEQYNRERLIASGRKAVDGEDGYFQLNFNVDFNHKPTIRPDGSVDYWSIHAVEMVEEGQVIAVYHEPISGENGMTVGGKPLMAKRGRPLPPLTGKGFERSEDGTTYTASITGKIEKVSGRIQILPVYEVSGNVDPSTGNIDFRGDVIIHGNVPSGYSIKATGTVTVDGIVEAARISADKDIILRGGVLGKGKAVIESKANITAKFLEYATVFCEGYLEASSALDCNIEVHDRMIMTDSSSVVVGGKVYAARGIDLNACGNTSEIHTQLQVGMDKVMAAKAIQLQQDMNNQQMMLDRINAGLVQFDELAKDQGIDISKDERRLGLLRARISTQAEINHIREQLDYFNDIIESSKGATVRIMKTIYPGVSVIIDNITANLKEEQERVEFILRDGFVVMVPVEL